MLNSEYDNELGTLNQPIGGGVAKVPSDEDSKEARTEAGIPIEERSSQNNSKRIQSLQATRRLAGIPMEEDTTAPLAVKG